MTFIYVDKYYLRIFFSPKYLHVLVHMYVIRHTCSDVIKYCGHAFPKILEVKGSELGKFRKHIR